jgi:hypothetical protein
MIREVCFSRLMMEDWKHTVDHRGTKAQEKLEYNTRAVLLVVGGAPCLVPLFLMPQHVRGQSSGVVMTVTFSFDRAHRAPPNPMKVLQEGTGGAQNPQSSRDNPTHSKRDYLLVSTACSRLLPGGILVLLEHSLVIIQTPIGL